MRTAKELENIDMGWDMPKPSKRHKIAENVREKTEAIANVPKMIEYLKEGNTLEASKIKMKLQKYLDPSSLEGYEDAVKECLQTIISEAGGHNEDDMEYAEISIKALKSDFGDNIDFLNVKGYEKFIQKLFLHYLKEELYIHALQLKEDLGKGADLKFEGVKEYEKAVKRGFLNRINYVEMKEAFDVIEDFGKDIDLSKEMEKAFKYLLKEGLPIEASELETFYSSLGTGLDLRSTKGYERAVQQGIQNCFKAHDENAAVLMESNFGEGKVVPLFGRKAYEEGGKRGRKVA